MVSIYQISINLGYRTVLSVAVPTCRYTIMYLYALGGLQRALTLPAAHLYPDSLRSPMRGGSDLSDDFGDAEGICIEVPKESPSRVARTGSDGMLTTMIPTFTVTINPLEENEMTFVPESPPEQALELDASAVALRNADAIETSEPSNKNDTDASSRVS